MTSMSVTISQRPPAGEYDPYYQAYIDLVPDGAIADILARQFEEYLPFYRGLTEAQGAARPAPDKWTLRQVLGHVCDTERVFGYRALAISRQERQSLPGFEQDEWIAGVDFDARPVADLVEELAAIRRSTVTLFAGMTSDMIERRGTANHKSVTVRAIGFVIAGHERHHVKILGERYLGSA